MLEAMLQQEPKDGQAIFVDMNSFFASCEQQDNPLLRGRPIGVCPFISDTTCVIAASIEAKAHGVKTAMRVVEAKRLCPEIQLVEARPRLYRRFHRLLMEQLDTLPCHVVAKSIDEAYLQVPSYGLDQATEIASQIKDLVKQVGDQLRCSIGVAPNLFLAKMGTNLHKPDGFMEIRVADLTRFYSQIRLLDLHGISWRMTNRLRDLGIYRALDFFQAPLPLLRQAFGATGEAWYLRLRGYEVDLQPTHRRMIGHQMTIIPRPATLRTEVASVASQLTYRAAIRLRQSGFAARGVVVSLRFDDRTYWKSVYHGRQPFFDSATFFQQVERLLSKCRLAKPVRLVSVSAIDLIERRFVTNQLFDNRSREEKISQAMDEINFRYGESSIGTGQQLLASQPRDAIGYGNATQNVTELPQ